MDAETKAKIAEQWEIIRTALATLDELADAADRERDEDDPPPEGQMLANFAIAYSTQHLDDEGDVNYILSYMVPDGVATETAVGLFHFAANQVLLETLGAIE